MNPDPRTRPAYLKPLRDWLADERAAIKASYLKRPQPDRNLRQHAAVVDALIARIATDIGLPRDVALVAVGGYGRGFLFPASDVDVLVLLPGKSQTDERTQSIEAFVSLLWDVGLEPGISVRNINECFEEASKDVTVDTSMLEARWLWGNKQLASRLTASLNDARNLPAFLDAKLDEQRRRHARHNDIALNLEPNLKESPGGLRDLQTVLWIARAANIGGDASADWSALAAAGLLTVAEAKLISKHRRVLIDLRLRLHYLAGRRDDRLVFGHHTTIAQQLKLKPTRAKLASEVLMRRYYLSAKIIWQLNSILLANLSERILRKKRDVVRKIDDDFELVNGSIAAIDVGIFQRDSRAIFRAFLALQHTREAEFFSAETLRAIWREVPNIDAAFREDRDVNNMFLEILQSERLTFTMRRLSRYGILGRYIPAFGRIVGQMQHDLFHVYTVDEHILMVLRNMRRLVLPRFAHEFPLCHELANAFGEKHVLYLACLFHDIAKGRGGDHSRLGTRDARRPHVWNGWKAKLLEDLFSATRRLLRGDSAVNPHYLEFKRRDALHRMNTDTEPPIWRHVNERYFQRFEVDDLAWHAEAIGDDIAPTTPRIFVREDERASLYEVLVLTPDDVGVFARLTNAFERLQLDIASARIYTTTNGYALDSFLVLPKSRQLSRQHAPRTTPEMSIQKELTKVLLAAEIPEPARARSARQAKHFPLVPEITLRRSRVAPFYEISITCADKPGLLSAIARALNESHINLHDARITTLGSRAEDVFIVEHARMAEPAFADALKTALLETVA